ncbi:MAG: hypothetical protein WA156_06010, partial [Methylocystis silviterrae]
RFVRSASAEVQHEGVASTPPQGRSRRKAPPAPMRGGSVDQGSAQTQHEIKLRGTPPLAQTD